jgi:DNA repair exonuclease SbcCD ATPase subunit
MIKFHNIVSRNFMSIGDNPISLNLDEYHLLGIKGSNGSGKSCFSIDALTFALFGKSFRGVNKSDLINTTNKKGTLVDAEFSVGTTLYKISRGIKPDSLTITKNGKLQDEAAATKDTQAAIESILGFDYEMFTKTIALGYANHTPFMVMDAKQRRDFVESALGLGVFAELNKIVKAEASTLNASIIESDKNLAVRRGKLETILESNKAIESDNALKIVALKATIAEIITQVQSNETEIKSVVLPEYDAALHKELELTKAKTETECNVAKIELFRIVGEIGEHKRAKVCPTCGHPMDENHWKSHADELESKRVSAEEKFNNLSAAVEQYEQTLKGYYADHAAFRNAESLISNLKATNEALVNKAKYLKTQIVELEKPSTIVDTAGLESELKSMESTHDALLLSQTRYKLALELLKDSGIKAGIISKYVPILNTKINQMLDIIGFGVRVKFDETFKETLVGRYADEFSYKSLSQGERERLNLAIMFAWYEVMKMASGIDTNLMIIDEIGSSALDGDGVAAMLEMIDKEKNCVIISHNQDAINACEKVLTVKKVSGFTKIY